VAAPPGRQALADHPGVHRTARIVPELLRGRLAEAQAELDAIVRFARLATDRHERSAAHLRGTS
jgi:hypothetical protein